MSKRYKVNAYRVQAQPWTKPNNGRVICGISLANPHYYGKRLKALLQYLDVEYGLQNVLLITAGYLYRHTYLNEYPLNPKRALEAARDKENQHLTNELLPLLKKDFKHANLTRWEDLLVKAEDPKLKNEFNSLIKTHPTLKTEFEHEAKTITGNSTTHNYKIEHGLNFLKEEWLVFYMLAKQNYTTFIYPGYFSYARSIVDAFSQGLVDFEIVLLELHRGRPKLFTDELLQTPLPHPLPAESS